MLLQFVCVGKRIISKIHVALEGKRELAIDKKSCGSWFVIKPMKYGLEWIQALIKGEHCFRGKTVVMYRHLRGMSYACKSKGNAIVTAVSEFLRGIPIATQFKILIR